MSTQNTAADYENSTPALRRAAYWEEVANKRIRLAWAALALGVLLGFITYAVLAMPPVWLDELQAGAGCGAL